MPGVKIFKFEKNVLKKNDHFSRVCQNIAYVLKIFCSSSGWKSYDEKRKKLPTLV